MVWYTIAQGRAVRKSQAFDAPLQCVVALLCVCFTRGIEVLAFVIIQTLVVVITALAQGYAFEAVLLLFAFFRCIFVVVCDAISQSRAVWQGHLFDAILRDIVAC